MKGYFVQVFLAMTILASAKLAAQTVSPLPGNLQGLAPVNLFPTQPASAIEIKDKFKATQPSKIAVQNTADGSSLLTAEVLTSSKNHYDVQASWKSTGTIKKGDVLLARFAIRSLYAKQESGEAVV